jgi:hypothetical protein
MTERTVTEQQVIDAMNKFASQNILGHYGIIFDELFPELPKANELVLVWDKGSTTVGGWLPFVKIRDDGRVIVLDEDGKDELWDEYRRQTPAERGEG